MNSARPMIVRDPGDPGDLGRLEVSGIRISRSRFAPLVRLGPHDHEFACLTVVLRGAVRKSFSTSTVDVSAPGAVAMPPRESHRARFSRDGVEVLMVEPMQDPSTMLGESTRLFDAVLPLADPVVSGLAWRLRREFASPDSVTPLAVTGMVLEMLASAARRSPAQHGRPAWIPTAEDYLRAHFMEPVDLSDLACAVHQLPARVTREFRTHLGTTPCDYVRRLRIDWAMREMCEGDRPLSDIGLAAGFADQSHFTRVFRRLVGVPPGRFRRSSRG
jgi:AraC family transcriptional regulator